MLNYSRHFILTTVATLIFINVSQAAPNIFEIVNLTNAERQREGLPPLNFSNLLNQAAQAHATDMANNNYFSHTNLEGLQVSDRVTAVGYSYARVGENIAYGLAAPKDTMQQWMNSTGHRQNILRPEYTEIGVGYAYSDSTKRRHIWVQVFGTPQSTTNRDQRRALPRDDSQQNTLVWVTSKEEAIAKASRTGKKVLLIAGRDECGNTQYTRHQLLEEPTLKSLLQQHMVLWYSNIDDDSDYRSYAKGIKGSYILPLIAVIDPSTPNQYLERFTGKDLKKLSSRLQRLIDNQ